MKTITTLIAAFIYMGISAQLPENLDYVSPFHEGFAAVQKENKWAFVDSTGNIAIDFRDDFYWNKDAQASYNDIRAIAYPQFSSGRCVVQKMMDDIPMFGFIDTSGKLVIEHKFLNVAPFENGLTTGIIFEKVFRGKNEFNLDIYEFKFHEVLMDADGNIIEFLNRRHNIQMTKRRYEMPEIQSKILNKHLITFKKDNYWEIKKLDF